MSIGTWTVSNSTLRRTKRGRGYWEYWRRVLTVNKFVWYCCLPFGFKMNLKQGILLSVIFLLLAFSANGIEFEGNIKWKYCWLSGLWLAWGKTRQLPRLDFGPRLTPFVKKNSTQFVPSTFGARNLPCLVLKSGYGPDYLFPPWHLSTMDSLCRRRSLQNYLHIYEKCANMQKIS